MRIVEGEVQPEPVTVPADEPDADDAPDESD